MTNFKKVSTLLLPAALLALSSAANAEYSQGTIDEATVLSADPVYRTVRINEPTEQCWDEKVHQPAHSGYKSHTPKILGAIVGAAVGNEFGKGRGKDIATVAGAVLGGSIGRDAQAHHRRSHHGNGGYSYQKRCELVDSYRTEERLDGYDVTYRYNGHVGSTFTKHDPGSTIRVSVNVVPVE
ncbi:MAG: glycine zipper 2TM domain-containing protein [Acidiferrobacterales bacterium]|nr:glycine zipper 2TM domain-containing protein [Acidiferrobacterales bacterium]